MKTIEQLQQLPASAKRRLASVMKQHGRTSLKNLYAFLVDHKVGAPPDKTALFSAAFEASYVAAKDYLLRHEIRLLGAEIAEVLATEEFLKQYRGNPSFRAVWKQRAARALGESIPLDPVPDAPSAKDFAYDQPVYWGDMLEFSLKHAVETSEIHSHTAQEMILAARKLIDIRQTEAARKLAQANLIHGTALRWAYEGPGASHLQDAQAILDLSPASAADPVASFLAAQFRSQCLQGKAKIQALEDGLYHLGRCHDSKLFDRAGKEMAFTAMIALEWYLLGEYENANACYEAALNKALQKKHPLLMAIVSNYMSNLLKCENYQRAIEVVAQHHAYFVDNPQAHFFLESLRAMSFIFLNQPSEALATVPHDIQQRRGGTYLTFRFVQMIAFYLQDDPEAAEREATNIAKMIRYWKKNDRERMKELEIDYLTIVMWLGQFFQAELQLAADRQERLLKLKAEILQHPAMHKPLFHDFLPLKWLRSRLG